MVTFSPFPSFISLLPSLFLLDMLVTRLCSVPLQTRDSIPTSTIPPPSVITTITTTTTTIPVHSLNQPLTTRLTPHTEKA